MNRKEIEAFELSFPDAETEILDAMNSTNALLCDIACMLKEIAAQLADMNEKEH